MVVSPESSKPTTVEEEEILVTCTPHPNVKSLQKDIETVQTLVVNAKKLLKTQINDAFGKFETLLSDPEKGVYARLNSLEDGTKETSNRVTLLEQKLSKLKEGENIIYETDPQVAEEQDKIKKEHDQLHKNWTKLLQLSESWKKKYNPSALAHS